MGCNVGKKERVIRIVVGVVCLASPGLLGFPLWGAGVAYVVGVVALVTGTIGFCPGWKLFGVNTCETKAPGHPSS